MIRWMSVQSRLAGFTYYPVWEIAFGLFLIMSAVAIPLLFFRFNGFQLKQTWEWLFCLGFLLFFGLLGKSLVMQFLLAHLEGADLVVEHNLRDPSLAIRRPVIGWTDTVTRQATTERGEVFHLLVLVFGTDAIEIYRSVSPTEIAALQAAFTALRHDVRPPAADAASPMPGSGPAGGPGPEPQSGRTP
ncbi:MAG: hypothetical protein GX442_04665 [Candidatus Riflebacteria bacterium]|nr:hypothetical protein [Candidatus Riflebacteria bacterium]